VTGAQFDRVRAVHIAVANELVELLPLLQSAGANINLVDEHGATPLHVAANLFNLASVTALLTLGAGASKQFQTLKGDTPLALAKKAMTWQQAPATGNAGDINIAARQYIPLLLE
jgi:ankyrin repeat protein